MLTVIAATTIAFVTVVANGPLSTVLPSPPEPSCGVIRTASGNHQEQMTAANMRALRGQEAKEFVTMLRARNSIFREAEARSAKILASRGYRPLTEYEVFLETNPSGAVARAKSSWWRGLIDWLIEPVAAQTYEADGGYVVWSAWDDGDNYTWEGNAFVNDGQGGWVSIDNQFASSQSDRPVYWARGERGGADGSRDKIGNLLLIRQTEGCSCTQTNPPAARCMLQNAFLQSIDVCGGAVLGCAVRPAVYWACVGGVCATNTAAKLIHQARLYQANCRAGI